MTKIEEMLNRLLTLSEEWEAAHKNLIADESARRAYWKHRHEIIDYVNGLETQLARQNQPFSYGDCPVCGSIATFMLNHQTMEAHCINPVCGYIAEIE